MIKLKDNISDNNLKEYGFQNHGIAEMIKTIGALNIYYNKTTHLFSGVGFYAVSDRIVLRNIQNIVNDNLIDITESN